MDGPALLERLEDEYTSELDRLGSSKLLIALTEADLRDRTVLETAAHSEFAARETFRGWASDETNERARSPFERTAAQEAAHYDRVRAELDEPFEPTEPGPLHAYLRQRTATGERVATGMIARSVVSVRVQSQIVSFFVNEAAEKRADLFRTLRSETEDTLEAGLDLLTALDTSGASAAIEATAGYVIRIAYDEYADALEALDIDPKPVC